MCGLTFIPPPPPSHVERSERIQREGRRQTEQTYERGGAMEWQTKCTSFHCFVLYYDAIPSQAALMCATVFVLLFYFLNFAHAERGFPHLYLIPHENKCTLPTAVEAMSNRGQQQRVKCKEREGFFSGATTETSLNFKAQSHTLIWILKLPRCLGASNCSFSKTIIMTNLCISSLPNPLSMSLAWGNAAAKLTQICDMWLPIGNGLKLGTRMVWVKSKHNNLVMVCTGRLIDVKKGPELLAVVGVENLRWSVTVSLWWSTHKSTF